MKIDDKYDIGKTLLLVAAFVIIAWVASGCASVGDLDEFDSLAEYRQVQSERSNRRVACERLHGVGSEYCR